MAPEWIAPQRSQALGRRLSKAAASSRSATPRRARRQADQWESSDPVLAYVSRMFPAVRIKGAPQDRERNDGDPLYEVRIIDNDYNTYQEVIDITMLALGVSEEEAYAVAWEVDHRGSCVVAEGTLSEAESVASVIRTIGIEVCVERIVDRGNC